MNIPTREEFQVHRVVVGNNTPTTHPTLGTIPVKGSWPLPVTKTGTITTDNSGGAPALAGKLVVGSGTLFKSELNEGDYLSDAAGAIRRIKFIYSDIMLELDAKFPSSLSAAAVKLVKKNAYRSILVESTGTATATLNEQSFKQNSKMFDDGAPISYDVSTASSEIAVTLSL